MADNDLFKHPEEEKEPDKIDLVSYIKDPEEGKRIFAMAEEARKRAEELLQEEPKQQGEPIDLVSFAKPNDGSEKKYLLLFQGFVKDTEEEVRDWYVVQGRRQAYEYIKMFMENDDIFYDLKQSKILVDVEKFSEAKSQYDFMEYIIENDLMGKDEIYPHLDDYDYLDDEEEEE